MPEWICLLRGINLGARNKVSMPSLREALSEAGMQEVRTYLQSGNVVLQSDLTDADELARTVRGVVAGCSGVDAAVMVRSPAEMREVVAWAPFAAEAAAEPKLVHIVHFEREPRQAGVDEALEADWGGDRLLVRGREAAISYRTSMHVSRLQYGRLIRLFGCDGTARNWRTELAIVELLSPV